MNDRFDPLADRFLSHYEGLRGQVRHRLVRDQLARHLAPAPAEVLDLGGGGGHVAIPLARSGYRVTLVDPSERMLDTARTALADEPAEVCDRVTLLAAADDDVIGRLGPESSDAVVSHGVLPYVDNAARHIATVAALLRIGGVASVLFKNRAALGMRGGIRGEWDTAIGALDADADVGGLGGTTKAQSLGEVRSWLAVHGVETLAWYGVRMFTDHRDDPPPDEIDEAVRLELAATHRDPYRSIGRLIHLVGRRLR